MPPPTRCHACTAVEHAAKAFEKQDAARALSFRATPSPALGQALTNPRLDVPPALPVTTTGDVAATPGEMVAWLTHHDLPVPDDLADLADPTQ